jgi:hypothetical protein
MHIHARSLPLPKDSCLTAVPVCEAVRLSLGKVIKRFKGLRLDEVSPSGKVVVVRFGYETEADDKAMQELLEAVRQASAGMSGPALVAAIDAASKKDTLADIAAALKPAVAPMENRETFPIVDKSPKAPAAEDEDEDAELVETPIP